MHCTVAKIAGGVVGGCVVDGVGVCVGGRPGGWSGWWTVCVSGSVWSGVCGARVVAFTRSGVDAVLGGCSLISVSCRVFLLWRSRVC